MDFGPCLFFLPGINIDSDGAMAKLPVCFVTNFLNMYKIR